MFDRTDALWRDEPTPAPADTSARETEPTVDQARQVEQRPDAPGQRPRSTPTDQDDQRTFDGEDRAHRPTDAAHDRIAREADRGWQGHEAGNGRPREQPADRERDQLATERQARIEDRAQLDAAKPQRRAARPPREVWPENNEGHTSNHHPLGPDGQAVYERAQERARHDPPAAPATLPEEHRQDRQARQDGRTWTEGRAWTDQDRAGIQRFTKPADPAGQHKRTDDQIRMDAWREDEARRAYYKSSEYHAEPRARFVERRAARRERGEAQPRTAGHRRELDGREAQPRDRRSRTDRDRDALADVGMYRAVSYTDTTDQHYDGHPYAARRAITRMVRAELVKEHEATGPQGNTFKVLTATERGRDAAHRAALEAGHVPEQQTWTGLVKPAELSHDTAVYRAALDERARIEADGGRVVRVRLDAELKSLVATATEKARAARGDRAADEAKAAAAQELGLPMQDGHVMYPDAQLEIEDADGVSGRVNVEIASDHYHAAAIVAKAGAGFAMHGSSPSAGQNISRALGRAAARETDSGPGGGSGPGRDGSVEL